ncbi:MAG: hypothetical protein KC615_16615 [Anaerolineae bacterium]|nr:hypothetical protein [Anaerolineae bacterium]
MTSSIIDESAQLVILDIVGQLKGQVCWQYQRTYGGDYHLDFGNKVKSGKYVFGEPFVSTWASSFVVKKNGDVLIDTRITGLDEPDAIKQIAVSLQNFVGEKVISIEIDFDVLSFNILFTADLSFHILPMAEDALVNLPYWEIMFSRWDGLSVGPGHKYEIKSKD